MIMASEKRKWLVMNRRGPWEGYISPFVSFPPSFERTFSSRERKTSRYEAELPLDNITEILKSHESVAYPSRPKIDGVGSAK